MQKSKEITSIWKLLVLHLLPGLLLMIVYLLLLNLNVFKEFPKLIILGISAMLSIVPFQLGYLLFVSYTEQKTFNIFKILGFKNKLKPIEFVIYTIVLFIIVGVIFTVLKPVTDIILNNLFSWIPDNFNYVEDFSQYDKQFIIMLIFVSFFVFTLIAPITEELYFRGFLLSRMNRMGVYGVLLNISLFAIYHFWSPWLIIVRIIAFLPLYYIVYKKQSLKLAIFVHCLANFTDVFTFIMLL